MRPSPHPWMRISISCFAVSAGRDLHMSRPIPLRRMQRRLSRTLYGRYGEPLRVVALNVSESWSRDVSEVMAYRVREIAEREHYELTQGTLDFIEAHMGRVMQPTLPLW